MSIYQIRRTLYQTASLLGLFSAATKGPAALVGFFWRRLLLRAMSSLWR